MTIVSVDPRQAALVLERAWTKVDDLREVPSEWAISCLNAVFEAKDVTFKYILVTGLLGKCTNHKIYSRALQTSSALKHSYDARSLCHKVVVPFEKTKGDMWGLSNEPFVNKPARHREHAKDNTQLRNKFLASQVHDVLEYANKAKSDEVFRMLVHVLRVGKQRVQQVVAANAEVETNLGLVVHFVEQFLRESDGGTRLASVVGAFIMLINEGYIVKVYPPNYSDKFAKTAGDIEIWHKRRMISAFECKHRPISLDDVNHGIRKATTHGVREYNFVGASGLVKGQEAEIREFIQTSASPVDVHLVDIFAVMREWAVLLNPVRRMKFGESVTRILQRDMHRSEVANQAAELWNSLE